MSAGSHWIVAIVVAVLIGGGLTLFIHRALLRRDETEAGIHALAGTSWREFIHLVLDAMSRRGFTRVLDHGQASGDSDYTLERNGQRWLLSCKHGRAFVLGTVTVKELANDIRLANADGGVLVTQGRIVEDAREPARSRNIELLDGTTLWPELRSLVKPEQLAEIRAGAARKARRRTLLAWILALVAGLAVFTLLPRGGGASAPSRPAGSSGSAPAPATEIDAPQTQPDTDEAMASELSPEQQRTAIASAVSTLPMVDRALWTSPSNLEVHLLDTERDALPGICPLIERYPDLVASRIQLTPPPGSDARTRFRQCRTY